MADITTLSGRLCAPVGGFGTSLLATLSALVSSTQSSISTATTIPTDVIRTTAVSSVLATATLAPNLGNPANILSYPICAVSLRPLSSYSALSWTQDTILANMLQ